MVLIPTELDCTTGIMMIMMMVLNTARSIMQSTWNTERLFSNSCNMEPTRISIAGLQSKSNNWRLGIRNIDGVPTLPLNMETLKILPLLLHYGALVGNCCYSSRVGSSMTSLNTLLLRDDVSRETKLTICRILIAASAAAATSTTTAAAAANDTAKFLEMSFENAILKTGWRILVDAGIMEVRNHPHHHSASYYRRVMRFAIRDGKLAVCEFLVNRLPQKVDPFVQENEEDDDDDYDDNDPFWNGLPRPSSLFYAAARESNTRILEYFLELWDARFSSSTGGKNSMATIQCMSFAVIRTCHSKPSRCWWIANPTHWPWWTVNKVYCYFTLRPCGMPV
jgi:hypothetical protein